MDVEIFTENDSSPFSYICPDIIDGRRYYKDERMMTSVMREFTAFLGLHPPLRTIEIGAGHGQEPSKALAKLGASASTLDADWNDYCTYIPTIDDLARIGDLQLYPTLAGRNETEHYLGDVVFIGDQRSQLKDERFDMIFYWGSIRTGGFCSSVDSSRTARDFSKKLSLKQRLEAPISNVGESGYMARVSEFFNRTADIPVCPHNIKAMKVDMLDNLLVWANYRGRRPKRALVFGLTPGYTFDYCRRFYKDYVAGSSDKEIRRAVNLDAISSYMEKKRPMSLKDVQDAYTDALSVFTLPQRQRITDLGLIDCIAVQY